MNIRNRIAVLAVSLLPVVGLAQGGAGNFRDGAHTISSAGESPEEIADAIVIFAPAMDLPLHIPLQHDRLLPGEVVRVEKGRAPRAIMMNANSFIRPLTGGEPVRMFLLAHSHENASYPVAILPYDGPPLESGSPGSDTVNPIALSIENPQGKPVFSIVDRLAPYSFSVTMLADEEMAWTGADLYVGVLSPNAAATFSWVVQGGTAQLVSGMRPLLQNIQLPLRRDIDVVDALGKDITHVFTGQEARGMYTVFAILVVTGESAADTTNWRGVTMIPLFVQ